MDSTSRGTSVGPDRSRLPPVPQVVGATGLETLLFRGATALALVQVNLHALAGAISLAAGLSAMVALPRLRPGVRAGIALFFGVLALVHGFVARDYVGIVAGGVLVIIGCAIPFVHRGERAATRKRRWAQRAVAIVGGLLVAYGVLFPIAVAVVVTHPSREPVGAPPSSAYETVSFRSSDGLELAGWYRPSRNRAAIVLVHGGGGDRTGAVAQAELLARHGYGVLLYDARGSGESEGSANTFGWRWDKDVAGALAYLRTRADVDPARIGGLGLSTGADVLIQAAAERKGISAVVADGATGESFADYRNLKGIDGSAPYWWTLYTAARVLSGSSPGEPLKEAVTKVSPTPLLLIATGGSIPEEVDFNRLYAHAAHDPVELWELPGVDHTAAVRERPQEYERHVVRFFDRTLLPE